jgi:hypothetical protein
MYVCVYVRSCLLSCLSVPVYVEPTELGAARREWHNKNYLGAAHGLCGILTILLYFKEVRWT